MTEPTSGHARRFRAVLDLIAAEDTDRLVPELLAFAGTIGDRWVRDDREVLDAVAADGFQAELVCRLAVGYHEVEPGAPSRRSIPLPRRRGTCPTRATGRWR